MTSCVEQQKKKIVFEASHKTAQNEQQQNKMRKKNYISLEAIVCVCMEGRR